MELMITGRRGAKHEEHIKTSLCWAVKGAPYWDMELKVIAIFYLEYDACNFAASLRNDAPGGKWTVIKLFKRL